MIEIWTHVYLNIYEKKKNSVLVLLKQSVKIFNCDKQMSSIVKLRSEFSYCLKHCCSYRYKSLLNILLGKMPLKSIVITFVKYCQNLPETFTPMKNFEY